MPQAFYAKRWVIFLDVEHRHSEEGQLLLKTAKDALLAALSKMDGESAPTE